MKTIFRIQCSFLICALLFTQSAAAIDLNSLSEPELKIIKKLGVSEEDLKTLDKEKLQSLLKEKVESEKNELKQVAKDRLETEVKEKIEPKLIALRSRVDKEKEELKKNVVKLAAGYMTSTISLFAATLIAPQVIMACKTKASAIIYAGTAAVYVFQEMRNIKILKASQLAEIEMVNSFTVDKNKSVKENARMLEAKVDTQVGYIKVYKKTLEDAVEALKNKSKNAKMVSIGFLASSATAVAEQMNWISGGGTCITSAPSLEQINFSKSLDNRYVKLINESQKTEDKWAYYYEWESLKFGVERTISPIEYDQLKKITVTSSILTHAIALVSNHLLASALAAEDSKKVTVAASLKNNKAADWMGDLDKLGIVGGLAVNVVAYMAGWQLGFLKSIIASGTSRAVTFGAQGALALIAGKLFEDAAKDMGSKLDNIEVLLNETRSFAKNGINLLVPSDADARRFQDIAAKIGVSSDKLITEMSLNEAQNYLKKIKTKVETLDDEGKELVKKFEDDLANKADELKNKVEAVKDSAKTSYIRGVWELFMPVALAASSSPSLGYLSRIHDLECPENKNCPTLDVPKYNHPKMAILNQYMSGYEKYYQGIKSKNANMEDRSVKFLEKNKGVVENFRSMVFKSAQENAHAKNTNYNDYEKSKIFEEINNFQKFYAGLPQNEREEMNSRLNPASHDYKASTNSAGPSRKLAAKLSPEEMKIVNQLVLRLGENTNGETAVAKMKPSELVTAEKSEQFNFGNINIHPKESELFDIIHFRYLKFLEKNFPEL